MKRVAPLALLMVSACGASELWTQGYAVIPAPREVKLAGGEVEINGSWTVRPERIEAGHIAVRSLLRDLGSFHGLRFENRAGGGVIRLLKKPGAVASGAVPEIDRQAYRLRIADGSIE